MPADQFASVVRADPKKAGLLYAGTDAGAYVSFDDGGHWQSLQHNLPTAWITDLLVHDGDLIAATEGRGIWVLDDVSPAAPDLRRDGAHAAHLFAPGKAWRVHADNNKDTPLPPKEPVGQNPPAGAMIDYWLGAPPRARSRSKSATARAMSCATSPAMRSRCAPMRSAISPRPGRVLGALRRARHASLRLEPALSAAARHFYSYSIAAVWGNDTPIKPPGPFVLPGHYTVTLTADGKSQSVPLHVNEDPRVAVGPAALEASLALSQKIAKALAMATQSYGEEQAVRKQLDARFPDKLTHAGAKRADTNLVALLATLRAKPAAGAPQFDTAEAHLTAVENALESADVAPTQVQNATVARAMAELDAAHKAWAARQAGPLKQLNALLVASGRKPVAIPASVKVEAPDPGQDLP